MGLRSMAVNIDGLLLHHLGTVSSGPTSLDFQQKSHNKSTFRYELKLSHQKIIASNSSFARHESLSVFKFNLEVVAFCNA
jgi:hypothetical protein